MNLKLSLKNAARCDSKFFRNLVLAAAIMVYILIVVGGIVRVTESGGACPDWPTCFGQWTPPVGQSAAIDYLHRLVTLLVAPLILAGAVIAWKRYRHQAGISRPLFAASALLMAQVILGAVISVGAWPIERSWISAVHLGLSLLVQAAVLSVVVRVFFQNSNSNRLTYQTPFARLSLTVLVAVFLLLISGIVVAGSQTMSACASWPLCSGNLIPGSLGDWINIIHRLIVAGASVLIGILLLHAWRTQRSQTPILVATTAAGVLFFAQALMGAKLVNGFPVYLLALHEATAVAVWAVLVVQVVAVGLSARSAEEERAEASQAVGRTGLFKDFLMLTKPIVVALLLVTTYAGMVIGARAWPSLSATLWTLFGGFLAAGGSGAINQYIDRYDDFKMQRTQKRPIPSGRLTPGEGLAFGVAIALASFYIMVAFVNFLAALLTLAGIVYYVLLYSIILKKTTVQNIVIGGGAGAIPPLVGWAAATGHLNVPSLFLFAVIFMWTPPHFWALALVRRKDYARAGVPMLPVVRGEKETRLQIFIYTAELVGLTLLLPLFGLGGSFYLVGAAALGGWLLIAAWRVWKGEGNKVAWRMYRYSSMYLAFLFFILMIDRLL
jgi:protoheme IX farnesyltransferase